MAAIVGNYVKPVVQEMLRIFPDSIVVGSGIYALLVQSFQYFVFFLSMLEAKAAFTLISYTTSFLNITPGLALPKSYTHICRSGFTDTATPLALAMFKPNQQNEFPSEQMYVLSVAASYLFSSLNVLSDELQGLGPAYASRYYVSVICLLALISIFMAFRISSGCETFGTIMATIPIGLLIGYALVQQNTRLISKDSVNLIGVPLLVNKAATGQPIYVCPK